MRHATLAAMSLFMTVTPSIAGDWGPVWVETDRHIDRTVPRVIERERIIERHYYSEPADTYVYSRPAYRYRDAYYGDGHVYRRPAYDGWGNVYYRD